MKFCNHSYPVPDMTSDIYIVITRSRLYPVRVIPTGGAYRSAANHQTRDHAMFRLQATTYGVSTRENSINVPKLPGTHFFAPLF